MSWSRALENEGVERIFGIPGEENLDFVDSLRRSSIELILTRHEQAAAFMAATYGRLTGKPGVVLTTLGRAHSTWRPGLRTPTSAGCRSS
jgi:acetolactate synthase-1/2/3 large subunit